MMYTLPELPEQTVVVPEIAPGVDGMALIVIDLELAAELPHALLAVTDTFPAVEPNVTVALVVPWPAETLAPVGTVHV
jgi:hypothetical protein